MGKWKKEGDRFLGSIPANALFLLGLKRSWLFPETRQDEVESRRENPKYTDSKHQKIRDLILEKETANQVFFLRTSNALAPFPGFADPRQVPPADPEVFQNASKWLQSHMDPVTEQPYVPLKLDPSWWRTRFKATDKRYTGAVDVIIKNFQTGAHDFAPVMELLFQSNPTLDVVR